MSFYIEINFTRSDRDDEPGVRPSTDSAYGGREGGSSVGRLKGARACGAKTTLLLGWVLATRAFRDSDVKRCRK